MATTAGDQQNVNGAIVFSRVIRNCGGDYAGTDDQRRDEGGMTKVHTDFLGVGFRTFVGHAYYHERVVMIDDFPVNYSP